MSIYKILSFACLLAFTSACKTMVKYLQPDPFPGSANLTYTAFSAIYNEGVDLYAYSNEAGWNLKLDFGNELIFATADGAQTTFRAESISWFPEDLNQPMQFDNGTNRLTLKLIRLECNDIMNGYVNTYKIELKLNDVSYIGCALQTFDKRINGIWKFNTLNGVNIPLSTSINNRLLINVDKQMFHGVFNCDSIYSHAIAEGKNLIQKDFGVAGLNCKMPKDQQQAFSALLQQVNEYGLKNDSTLLLTFEKTQLEFSRIEE